MSRRRLLVLIVLLAAGEARAQDANYWSNQYGTRAEMLGGLVVGSAGDLSASYYNPGWLALRLDTSLLVTTQALEYTTLRVADPVGTGDDASYTQFRPSPRFLGGRLKGGGDGWTMTWAYLEQTRFRYDATARYINANPAPSPDGTLWFSGEVFRQTETHDYLYGASFSHRIGERTAIGFTPGVSYRSQNQRIQVAVQAMGADGQFADIYVVDQFDYWHARGLAKIGLACDYKPVSFGLTVTTPSLPIMGSGEVYRQLSSDGLDLDGDDLPDTYLAATEQKDLDARWKSALSVAVGAGVRFGRTGLYATAEWFNAVPGYEVITTAPYQAQSDGETLVIERDVALRSLINFGFGIDHRFSEEFALYGAFRSDYAAQNSPPASDVLMTTWNLWHATVGSSFRFLGIELTSGLEYSFGSGTTTSWGDYSGDGSDAIEAAGRTAGVDYDRLKLLFGFDLAVLTGSS